MKHSKQGKIFNIFSSLFSFLKSSNDSYEDAYYDDETYSEYLTEEEKVSYLKEFLPNIKEEKLETLIQHTEEAESRKFSHDLFRLLNEKKISNTQCRENACMSQQVFSKIINSNPGHRPEKKTVIHLAMAMKLSLEETELFLNQTGYALTNRYVLDIVAIFLIENKIYDVQILDECVQFLSDSE